MTQRFIAVEGPIGVGKTTLARQIASHTGASCISDTEQENPYLESFYRQPRRVALHTQLHFLVTRLEILQSARVRDTDGPLVADFMLEKDRLFAELTLDEHEWWMYRKLHERLTRELPQPDLVVYLQAPLERLIQRIERRGLRHEQRIGSHYLQQLIDSYERLFHSWDTTPLLIVNAADINLEDSPADTAALIEQIRTTRAGRHYLNPVPEMA